MLQKSAQFEFSDLIKNPDYRQITAILVILPLLIYWQVWDFELLWDDYALNIKTPLHLDNPYVLDPTFANLVQLFTSAFFNMYIPISYLFWGWLGVFSEVLGLAFNSVLHLVNVILHIINGLLIFVIIRQFVTNKWAVLLGVLVFLLHPIQVESVAWVSEFRGLLAAFFTLLALYFYMRGRGGEGWWLFLPLLFLFFGLLSKPSAAVLPLFILAINHFYYDFDLKTNLLKTAPFALITLFLVVFTYLIQSSSQADFNDFVVSFWQRPLVFFDSIVFYLMKIIAPLNLSASYALSPKFIIQQWWFFPLALVPLAFGALLFFARHKYRLLVLAFVLFICGFLATSGLVSFSFQKFSIVADRYLYLAFFGIALVVAAILNEVNKKYIWALFISALLIFTYISAFLQIPIWQDRLKLWSHSVKFEVRPSYAKTNLEVTLYHDEAIFRQIFDTAQQTENDDKKLDGFNYLLKFQPELPLKPWLAELFYQRSKVFSRQGKFQDAVLDLTQSLKIEPKNFDFLNAKITGLIQLKQYKNAWSDADFLQKIGGKIDEANLAKLQKNCEDKNCQESRFFYNDKQRFFAIYNQGLNLAIEGEGNSALRFFDYLLSYHPEQKYQPRYERLFYNRGIVLMQQEAFDLALSDFASVLQFNPAHLDAHIFRIRIFVTSSRCDDALAELPKINAKKLHLPTSFMQNLTNACQK